MRTAAGAATKERAVNDEMDDDISITDEVDSDLDLIAGKKKDSAPGFIEQES